MKARAGEYDLILDARHFTAYRVENLHYRILAKVNDTVSFSLVTRENQLIFSADELVGKRVASVSPPSLSGIALHGLFRNPVREPRFVDVDNVEDAVKQVLKGKTVAALA